MDKQLVPNNQFGSSRTELLFLDTSSFSNEGALPSYLPLFEGMPVILRYKNLCVELCVANGSQGTIHKIETEADEYGFLCAQVVLVRFPGCKVQLSGLPPEVFPIQPITWRFSTSIAVNGIEKVRHTIIRHQLPLQPSFAVTGHSAQGKTLPKVLVNLKEGGFPAYVAASRARQRGDLFLMKAICLKDLNHPLPRALKLEHRRLKIMSYNTQVRHGLLKGKGGATLPLIPLPDTEDAATFKDVTGVQHTWEEESELNKRKSSNEQFVYNNVDTESLPKRIRLQTSITLGSLGDSILRDTAISQNGTGSNSVDKPMPDKRKGLNKRRGGSTTDRDRKMKHRKKGTASASACGALKMWAVGASFLPGCQWVSNNWTCAYDSVMVAMLSMYLSWEKDRQVSWGNDNELTQMLHNRFTELIANGRTVSSTVSSLNTTRDELK